MPDFVAIDGEADRDGRYILLCDSLGNVLHNPDGITSKQAFHFLLRLKAPKRQIVCFGLNYDANQWLKDLSEPYLRRLNDDGKTVWQMRYKLTWWPSKYFSVKDLKEKRTVKVCEVFGFFQTSFVKALREWGLEAPEEIEIMKGKRGTFTEAELGRITRYCLAECKLLVTLMERLAQACDTAGCTPARDWIGAGAIASSLLSSKGVKEHHAYDADIAERDCVENYILRAYYGGRVEMLAQGVLPVCHTRDIRSAYPSAATFLPSLQGATMVYLKDYSIYNPSTHAIWRVQWRDQCHGQLAPFPVRTKDGSICYPASGEGAYHHVEVMNALRLGYDIQVMDGWVLRPANDCKPFAWIPEMFAHRAALKRKGDAAEKALKLGLNSVYGKLAQGYGHGRPPFQSYMWAGEITARTRALMLKAAHQSTGVAMISTDGIFTASTKVPNDTNVRLGSWEGDRIDDLFIAQPGVYHGVKDGNEIVKSRGFFAKEVEYDQLRDIYESDGTEGVYHYTSRRFIGLRVALHRNRLDLWRKWTEEPRSITLTPQRKRIGEDGGLYPLTEHLSSIAYKPKESLYDDPTDSQLENMIADDQQHYEGFDDH